MTAGLLHIQNDRQHDRLLADVRVEETPELHPHGFLKIRLKRARADLLLVLDDDLANEVLAFLDEKGLLLLMSQALGDDLGARHDPARLDIANHEGEDDPLLAHLPPLLENDARD